MNRITGAIERAELGLASMSPQRVASLEAVAVLGVAEYVAIQDAKSLAHAGGAISFEEATSLYAILGQSLVHFGRQPLAFRLVAMKVGLELLASMPAEVGSL